MNLREELVDLLCTIGCLHERDYDEDELKEIMAKDQMNPILLPIYQDVLQHFNNSIKLQAFTT